MSDIDTTTKRLYHCRAYAEIDLVVYASSSEEARRVADESARDEQDNMYPLGWDIGQPRTIDVVEHIPPQWEDACPYGGEDDRSVLEILEASDDRSEECQGDEIGEGFE